MFDKRGKAELEIPIIYSGEEAIISFIPFADILHVQTILVNKASTRELETILDNNFPDNCQRKPNNYLFHYDFLFL